MGVPQIRWLMVIFSINIFPHNFVWGSCFWFCIPGRLLPASSTHNFVTHHLSHTTLSTTICHTPSFTHNFVNHHLSHTIFHIQLCQPPSFTHNFVTHHLSHIQLCQPPSFTHNFVTHHLSHTTLSTTIFHTHNFVTHTIFHIQLCQPLSWRHLPSFGVAGRALGHIHLRFAWQAWHLWHWVACLGRF